MAKLHDVPTAAPTVARSKPITISGKVPPGGETILTKDALAFLRELTREFAHDVTTLLARRAQRQCAFDAGALPMFLPETHVVREGDWRIDPVPAPLQKRQVEITGPADRKMMINALNSGADVFMADLEDACSPTWRNVINGQINIRDAVAGSIDYINDRGRHYRLNDRIATLMVRPRGWHLMEHHLRVDGQPIPAAFVDFGLFVFHNAHALSRQGLGPYVYLPKLENHREARLWNEVFRFAQEALGLDSGTIRATVLIETLPAVFEMHEILHELREHAAGLNCGRWDYIFSYIKSFRFDPERCLPDRSEVTMTQPFMRAYTQLLVQTCHKRGAHAIGGMAAQIPIKSDPEANDRAMAHVRDDKRREAADGHDGTWVAHPGLVELARSVFNERCAGDNQLHGKRDDVHADPAALLATPTGSRSEAGVRQNIRIGVQYLDAWLRGVGCVPLEHLMEDAATAEISRTQLWQWLHHHAELDDGRTVTRELFDQLMHDELAGLEDGCSEQAVTLFDELVTSNPCPDFLTSRIYQHLQ